MHTLEKQEYTEDSWRNIGYNDKFKVEIRLKHGFVKEYTYFQLL